MEEDIVCIEESIDEVFDAITNLNKSFAIHDQMFQLFKQTLKEVKKIDIDERFKINAREHLDKEEFPQAAFFFFQHQKHILKETWFLEKIQPEADEVKKALEKSQSEWNGFLKFLKDNEKIDKNSSWEDAKELWRDQPEWEDFLKFLKQKSQSSTIKDNPEIDEDSSWKEVKELWRDHKYSLKYN